MSRTPDHLTAMSFGSASSAASHGAAVAAWFDWPSAPAMRLHELTPSRPQHHTRVDLAALLRSSAARLKADLRRAGARLTLQLPDAGVLVRGDVVMLQQVVLNLVRNALAALCTLPPDDPHVVLRLLGRPNEVEIQVGGNGCGLRHDTETPCCAPLVSSQPVGMGIVMSICRAIVQRHQGRLSFGHDGDRGAIVHISLPPLVARPKPL